MIAATEVSSARIPYESMPMLTGMHGRGAGAGQYRAVQGSIGQGRAGEAMSEQDLAEGIIGGWG